MVRVQQSGTEETRADEQKGRLLLAVVTDESKTPITRAIVVLINSQMTWRAGLSSRPKKLMMDATPNKAATSSQ